MFWFEVMVYQYTTVTIKLLFLYTSVNKCVLQTVCPVLLSPHAWTKLLCHCTNFDST